MSVDHPKISVKQPKPGKKIQVIGAGRLPSVCPYFIVEHQKLIPIPRSPPNRHKLLLRRPRNSARWPGL